MNLRSKAVRVILPLAIILLGIAVMAVLVKSRSAPKKGGSEQKGLLVHTMTVKAEDRAATIKTTATVNPALQVSVIPQVSGIVISVADGFSSGGFFKKGALLFHIDDTDYRLALSQAKAAEAKAEFELERIKSQASIARDEWEIMSEGETEGKPNPLVLYEPQLKNAKASLDSAASAVRLAELNAGRTKITAPFDCMVRSEDIDVGQYVRSGTPVAEIVGTKTAEVVVPLLQGDLEWIETGTRGSEATVTDDKNNAVWHGIVTRSFGEVDTKTRMVKVVVEVEDPYGQKSEGGATHLLFGSFVDVEIKGRELSGVFVIPRSVIREASTVWTMDGDGMLRIKKVNVLRIEGENAIVSGGLEDNDEVVVTNISGAAKGMKLRTASGEAGEIGAN
jgi:RND family efflux transporter MFP subunit